MATAGYPTIYSARSPELQEIGAKDRKLQLPDRSSPRPLPKYATHGRGLKRLRFWCIHRVERAGSLSQ